MSTKKEEQQPQEPVKVSQSNLLQALITLFTIKRLRDHREDGK